MLESKSEIDDRKNVKKGLSKRFMGKGFREGEWRW